MEADKIMTISIMTKKYATASARPICSVIISDKLLTLIQILMVVHKVYKSREVSRPVIA